MMDVSRTADYIHSLEPDFSPCLEEIYRGAVERFIPVIRRETASFLSSVMAMKNAGQILEIGTAVGFSALFMAEHLPENGHITTIESYEPRIIEAKENIKKARMEEKITLLEGDASKILPSLDGSFDMIFMDAAKGQYLPWLPNVLNLMEEGSVLISDNIFQDGELIESRYAVERRNRTIHSRMREYLYVLKHTPSLVTSLIPLGDGISVSVFKNVKGQMK